MDQDECDPSELESFLQSCLDNASLLDSVDPLGTGIGSLSPVPPPFPPLSAPPRVCPSSGPGPPPRAKHTQPPRPVVQTKAALKQQASGALPPSTPPAHAAVAAPFASHSVRSQPSPASAASPHSSTARSPGQSPAPVSSPAVPGSTSSHRSPPSPHIQLAASPVLSVATAPLTQLQQRAPVPSSPALPVPALSHFQLRAPVPSSPALPVSAFSHLQLRAPVAPLSLSHAQFSSLALPSHAPFALCPTSSISSAVGASPALLQSLIAQRPPTLTVVSNAGSLAVSSSHMAVTRTSGISVTSSAGTLQHTLMASAVPPQTTALSAAQLQQASLRALVSMPNNVFFSQSPIQSFGSAPTAGLFAGGAVLPAGGLSMVGGAQNAAFMQLVCGGAPSMLAAAPPTAHQRPIRSGSMRQPQLLPKTLAPSMAASLKQPLMLATGQPTAAPLLLMPVVVPLPGGGAQLQYVLREQPAPPPAVMLPGSRHPHAVLLPMTAAGGGHTVLLQPPAAVQSPSLRLLAPPSLLTVQQQQQLPLLASAQHHAGPVVVTSVPLAAASPRAKTSSKKKLRRDEAPTASSKRTFVDLEDIMKKSGIFGDVDEVDDGTSGEPVKSESIVATTSQMITSTPAITVQSSPAQQTPSVAASTPLVHPLQVSPCRPSTGVSAPRAPPPPLVPLSMSTTLAGHHSYQKQVIVNGTALVSSPSTVGSALSPASMSVSSSAFNALLAPTPLAPLLSAGSVALRSLAPQLNPTPVPAPLAPRKRDHRRRDAAVSSTSCLSPRASHAQQSFSPGGATPSSRLPTSTGAPPALLAAVLPTSPVQPPHKVRRTVLQLPPDNQQELNRVQTRLQLLSRVIQRSARENDEVQRLEATRRRLLASAQPVTLPPSPISLSSPSSSAAVVQSSCHSDGAAAVVSAPLCNIAPAPAHSRPNIVPAPAHPRPNIATAPAHFRPNIAPAPSYSRPNIAPAPALSRLISVQSAPALSRPSVVHSAHSRPTSVQSAPALSPPRTVKPPHQQSVADQLRRRDRFTQQLALDQRLAAACPDTESPFSGVGDMVRRLLSYHVLSESPGDPAQLRLEADVLAARAQYIHNRRQHLQHKYRRLLLRDSMRPHSTSEAVQLLRYVNQHDKEQLEQDRRAAARSQQQLCTSSSAERVMSSVGDRVGVSVAVNGVVSSTTPPSCRVPPTASAAAVVSSEVAADTPVRTTRPEVAADMPVRTTRLAADTPLLLPTMCEDDGFVSGEKVGLRSVSPPSGASMTPPSGASGVESEWERLFGETLLSDQHSATTPADGDLNQQVQSAIKSILDPPTRRQCTPPTSGRFVSISTGLFGSGDDACSENEALDEAVRSILL